MNLPRNRRKFATAWLLAALLTLVGTQASAVSISMDPSNSVLGLGDSVDIALNVSGLGDFAPDSLGVFDIDVAYDASVLQLNFVSFGDVGLGGSQLALFFPSVQVVTPVVGSVNLFELSLDLPSDLDTFQPGSFQIATLTFELIAAGTSAITPSINIVGDSLGLPLQVESVTGAEVASAIPEPSAAVLWIAGLLVVRRGIRGGRR